MLSLVVIFTQSIQLSKIVGRVVKNVVAFAPLGGSSIPAQGSTSVAIYSAVAQPEADVLLESIPYQVMVELTGIEPMTSCLQSRRSPN